MKFTKWRLAIGIIAVTSIGATAAVADHVFDDLPDERFYAEPAEWARDIGITVGCNGGVDFCGEDSVTRGENITFAFRYDDLVVQPKFDSIDAEIDALQADAITHGTIVMSHGTTGLTARFGSEPSTLDSLATVTRVSGDGTVNLAIDGPISIGGTQYGLENIQFCITDLTGGAFVTTARVFGATLGGAITLANDSTDRAAAECYTLAINDADSYAYTLQLVVDGGGDLFVHGVQTTWNTATALAPASTGTVTTGDPNG